jgi:hypothetical protein
MKLDSLALRTQVEKAAGAFIQYRRSEATKELVGLIDALIEQSQFDLLSVSKENLERKQGAVGQLILLRKFIIDPEKNTSLKI